MPSQHDKILFATSEIFPLIKTGGLADVSSGLPLALHKKGVDIKVILPAYLDVKRQFKRIRTVAEFDAPLPGKLLAVRIPQTTMDIWLVDIPQYFDRVGNPYSTRDGYDWPDNAERFVSFCKVIAALATGEIDAKWQPDIIHCNDWQTGLVPALLNKQHVDIATLFTIHNLAYQGNFSHATFNGLKLDPSLWSSDAMEFHGHFSMIKGGLVYADKINTVSPNYADEIKTSHFGHGMEGLLQHRTSDLYGIVNGIDDAYWNPATDTLIEQNYSHETIDDKYKNKTALQKTFALPQRDVPLIGTVGRIAHQKGYDLIIAALPELMQQDIQIVILGSGDKTLEGMLSDAMQQYPEKLSVKIGYNENLAHLLEAGSDMFLMPSRFEPCGLNQIYSQLYGTVPIVSHTGGLADTVKDANPTNLEQGIATGFHFYETSSVALSNAVLRALMMYRDTAQWQKLMRTGMMQDFSWAMAADNYLSLYQNLK